MKREFIREFIRAKNNGINAVSNKQFERALGLFDYAGRIAFRFPIIENYIDNEIENQLSIISQNVLPTVELCSSSGAKIVYYCSVIRDNSALIEQYLDFFIEHDYQTLVIVSDQQTMLYGQVILNKIERAKNLKLFVAKGKVKITRIKQIYNEIILFNPTKAFLHLMPYDVLGVVLFNKICGIPRYFITHSDHTFWFGKKCADYFIEFRDFGIAMDVERRGISLDRIYKLPFYPINNKLPFAGLPFNINDKVVGISGASLYKYYLDKDLTYFKVIAELLQENENFVFCLASVSGDPGKIIQVFREYKVEERFYYLGYRKDFYRLIGECDIMFESYPLKGGLTMLFGIEQNIPVVGISTQYNASGSLQDFLGIPNFIEPVNFLEFKESASKLIKSEKLRNSLAEVQNNNAFKKDNFNSSLLKLLNGELEKMDYSLFEYKLMLEDEKYLNEYMILPDVKYATLARYKLKSQFSLRNRLNVFFGLFMHPYRYSIRDYARLLLLVTTGY